MRRFSNKQAKIARITNLATSTFRKRKNKEGLREVRKFAKIAKERSRTYLGR